jgi:hypothetical protein
MSKIKIDPNQVNALCGRMRGVRGRTEQSLISVSTTINNLDWQVAVKSNIAARLTTAQKRLRQANARMESYAGALDTVGDAMRAKDAAIRDKARGIVYDMQTVNWLGIGATTLANANDQWRQGGVWGAFASTARELFLPASTVVTVCGSWDNNRRIIELIEFLNKIFGTSGESGDGGAASKSDSASRYSVRQIQNPPGYERVYEDGYRERISEQGFKAEQARGYVDYDTWGKEPGSIGKLDYAIIADIPNKSSEEAWQYICDNFPGTHPFRQGKFEHGNIDGLDYCIFKIDDDHAIVSFGGTKGDDSRDVLDDIRIATTGASHQAALANELIHSLPYDNIMVTGHSLGGFVAADVAVNNSKVKECVTFDAPGHGGLPGIGVINQIGALWNTFSGNTEKITNYYAVGDVVHKAGAMQLGRTYSVDVGPDPITYGDFGAHDPKNFINAWT